MQPPEERCPTPLQASGCSRTLEACLDNLAGTRRGRKQLVSIGVDALLVIISLWLAYSLRHGQPFGDIRSTWHLFLLMPVITVLLFAGLGIYRWMIRSSNHTLSLQLVKGGLLSAVALVLVAFLLPPERVTPRSLFVLYGCFLVCGTIGVRLLWRDLFRVDRRGEPVAVYGAGNGGRQLVVMLAASSDYRPVLFFDDDARKHGTMVSGLPVRSGDSPTLAKELARREVTQVVIAMPSLPAVEFELLYSRLSATGLTVRTMPKLTELVGSSRQAPPIRDIAIGDILGRIEVVPDPAIIGRCVSGRAVLVTGGGGSIGSELCRQIARLKPARLVVLDDTEANLYAITEQLTRSFAKPDTVRFQPVLGSVTDRRTIDRVLAEHAIETVYHAAAYKHVPIVERQPERGVETNIGGTLTLVDAAIAAGVEHFVLISTDKAVRPTNAMGATKRVAELVLQAKARERHGTRISMVRFGNVLGSSGSVVPKFRRQIAAGGPITITHPDITRYFMTIPEAAQLVLQAGAIARGGDVFVLDMGAPIRIVELAKTMVRLSGRRLFEETGSPGDIHIVFDGLRPGEKMYEELFINDNRDETGVGKVFTAHESWLPWRELKVELEALHALAEAGDAPGLRAALLRIACDESEIQQAERVSTGVTLAVAGEDRVGSVA